MESIEVLLNEEVNVLASDADWAWPDALKGIFKPRGVNLLMAESVGEFVNIIGHKRIHTTIVDADNERTNGMAMIKVMRMEYPRIPCIMLSSRAEREFLSDALRLEIFSVIGKPVNMGILQGQLNRLFIKRYHSDIFAA
jgi:DNA-binding NtrC family response regulator